MFLKPKHFIFECRPNFGSFCPLSGHFGQSCFRLQTPPSRIFAYAPDWLVSSNLGCEKMNDVALLRREPSLCEDFNYKMLRAVIDCCASLLLALFQQTFKSRPPQAPNLTFNCGF